MNISKLTILLLALAMIFTACGKKPAPQPQPLPPVNVAPKPAAPAPAAGTNHHWATSSTFTPFITPCMARTSDPSLAPPVRGARVPATRAWSEPPPWAKRCGSDSIALTC